MKKIFGVLLQLSGLILVVASAAALIQLECDRRVHNLEKPIDLNRTEDFGAPQVAFLFIGVFGLLLFVFGMVLLLTKTAAQRQIEAELTTFRYLTENGFEGEDPLVMLEQLHELKQRGVITETEFSDLKKKMFA